MNYRHAFHAGNHADVLKHLALVFCLDALKRKPTPFAVLDTHAGRGLYDLESDEARRSPEWQGGIARLRDWPGAPAPVRAYLDAVADARFYPGSPTLIARALRAEDRFIGCELHPEEFAALKRLRLPGRIELHHRDGYEALGALVPFAEKRGLVLIDPPYEATDELAQAVDALKIALKRFRQGVYVWWRPLKDAQDLAMADADLGAPALRADLWIDTPQRTGKLMGSSLLIINPPFGLEEALPEALPAIAARLGVGDAGFRVMSGANTR